MILYAIICNYTGRAGTVLTLAYFITAIFCFFDFVQFLRMSIHWFVLLFKALQINSISYYLFVIHLISFFSFFISFLMEYACLLVCRLTPLYETSRQAVTARPVYLHVKQAYLFLHRWWQSHSSSYSLTDTCRSSGALFQSNGFLPALFASCAFNTLRYKTYFQRDGFLSDKCVSVRSYFCLFDVTMGNWKSGISCRVQVFLAGHLNAVQLPSPNAYKTDLSTWL